MRVLVVGGAGYIGSVTVRELIDCGHRVTVIDNLSTGHEWAIDKRADYIKWDLVHWRYLLSKGFDAIMHFAERALVRESIKNPLPYIEGNVRNTIALLKSAVQYGVERFIYSSSCSVYGDLDWVPVTENHKAVPISPYGLGKAYVESILPWFNVDWVAFRYFNAAGAVDGLGEDHKPESHLIPLAIQAVLEGEPFTVNGTDYDTPDGTCVRDFVHVKDLARAHVIALEKGNGIYNLGSGVGFSILEVIKAIEEVSGKSVPWVEGPQAEGDPAILVADYTKAQNELGWKPEYGLREIVESAWEWHSERAKSNL